MLTGTLPIPITSVTRAYLDLFEQQGDRARIAGWIFREDVPLERIDISLHGRPWIEGVRLHERTDVKDAFEPIIGSCSHISRSGFDVTAPIPRKKLEIERTTVGLTPYTPGGLRLDTLQTHFESRSNGLKDTPLPPESLRLRIGGSENFISVGTQLVDLLITYVGKYKPMLESGMILDWGCGCGRVIQHLIRFIGSERICGCDIDAAAIAWDKENIVGPQFDRIAPHPPTLYESDSFDIIYGVSVMTHLGEEVQTQWLEELNRIARPGAIVALSIIGETLRAANMPVSVANEFATQGFASFIPNYSDLFSDFSYPGYYQEAYHSLAYIAAHWGQYFEVLECVETKHQDIILLRKN